MEKHEIEEQFGGVFVDEIWRADSFGLTVRSGIEEESEPYWIIKVSDK